MRIVGCVSRVSRSCHSGTSAAYPARVPPAASVFRKPSPLDPPPYRVPRAFEPLRIAFVVQGTFFDACAMHGRTAQATCAFVEFRSGADADAMRAEVKAHRPHVVAVFRPE